jgi:hypothetical protein
MFGAGLLMWLVDYRVVGRVACGTIAIDGHKSETRGGSVFGRGECLPMNGFPEELENTV